MLPSPLERPALLLGEQLLRRDQLPELRFVAARALCALSPGRKHAMARSGSDLKIAFIGALTACRPQLSPADPGGQIAAFRARLQGAGGVLDRLGPLVDQLFGSGGKINLSEWMRAVRRSSARVALVVADDLEVALRVVADDQPTRLDLIDFALSERYASLTGG